MSASSFDCGVINGVCVINGVILCSETHLNLQFPLIPVMGCQLLLQFWVDQR